MLKFYKNTRQDNLLASFLFPLYFPFSVFLKITKPRKATILATSQGLFLKIPMHQTSHATIFQKSTVYADSQYFSHFSEFCQLSQVADISPFSHLFPLLFPLGSEESHRSDSHEKVL